jgi:hypothetical protein
MNASKGLMGVIERFIMSRTAPRIYQQELRLLEQVASKKAIASKSEA